MARCNVLAGVIGLMISSSAIAADPTMEPIENFVKSNSDSNSEVVSLYIGLRCYSLFNMVHVYFKNDKTDKESVRYNELSKKYEIGANRFFELAYNNQNPKNDSYIVDQSLRMTLSYKELFLNAKANTGNFTDDPVIRKDLDLCSALLSE